LAQLGGHTSPATGRFGASTPNLLRCNDALGLQLMWRKQRSSTTLQSSPVASEGHLVEELETAAAGGAASLGECLTALLADSQERLRQTADRNSELTSHLHALLSEPAADAAQRGSAATSAHLWARRALSLEAELGWTAKQPEVEEEALREELALCKQLAAKLELSQRESQTHSLKAVRSLAESLARSVSSRAIAAAESEVASAKEEELRKELLAAQLELDSTEAGYGSERSRILAAEGDIEILSSARQLSQDQLDVEEEMVRLAYQQAVGIAATVLQLRTEAHQVFQCSEARSFEFRENRDMLAALIDTDALEHKVKVAEQAVQEQQESLIEEVREAQAEQRQRMEQAEHIVAQDHEEDRWATSVVHRLRLEMMREEKALQSREHMHADIQDRCSEREVMTAELIETEQMLREEREARELAAKKGAKLRDEVSELRASLRSTKTEVRELEVDVATQEAEETKLQNRLEENRRKFSEARLLEQLRSEKMQLRAATQDVVSLRGTLGELIDAEPSRTQQSLQSESMSSAGGQSVSEACGRGGSSTAANTLADLESSRAMALKLQRFEQGLEEAFAPEMRTLQQEQRMLESQAAELLESRARRAASTTGSSPLRTSSSNLDVPMPRVSCVAAAAAAQSRSPSRNDFLSEGQLVAHSVSAAEARCAQAALERLRARGSIP